MALVLSTKRMRGAKTVQLEKSMALCVQTADALLDTQRQENQKWRSVCGSLFLFCSSIENSDGQNSPELKIHLITMSQDTHVY